MSCARAQVMTRAAQPLLARPIIEWAQCGCEPVAVGGVFGRTRRQLGAAAGRAGLWRALLGGQAVAGTATASASPTTPPRGRRATSVPRRTVSGPAAALGL
jgi:hypothetical protein